MCAEQKNDLRGEGFAYRGERRVSTGGNLCSWHEQCEGLGAKKGRKKATKVGSWGPGSWNFHPRRLSAKIKGSNRKTSEFGGTEQRGRKNWAALPEAFILSSEKEQKNNVNASSTRGKDRGRGGRGKQKGHVDGRAQA